MLTETKPKKITKFEIAIGICWLLMNVVDNTDGNALTIVEASNNPVAVVPSNEANYKP